MKKKPYKGKIPPQNLNLSFAIKSIKGLGCHSCSTIRGQGKKYTAVCPTEGCNYTSRIWITGGHGVSFQPRTLKALEAKGLIKSCYLTELGKTLNIDESKN